MLGVIRPCFSFHRQALSMACRKDLLFENEFLNKKLRRRNMTLLEKIKDSTQQNKRRMILAGIFVFVFSLGFLYDIMDRRRKTIKAMLKEAKALMFGYEKIYNKTLAEIHRSSFAPRNEQQSHLGEMFLQLDKRLRNGVTTQHLRELLMNLNAPTQGLAAESSVTLNEFMLRVRNSGVPLQSTNNEMQRLLEHPNLR